MSKPFFEQPVLNSPYLVPTRHHALSEEGQPLGQPPIAGRRRCRYVAPVPKAKKRRRRAEEGQGKLDLGATKDEQGQEYDVAGLVNEIREQVAAWRRIPNPNDWGVTPSTQSLLQHWRNPPEEAVRPFFCQVEAVETVIWLTEVARGRSRYAHIWRQLQDANAEANPELFRIAMKMATGSGKTTVMAMLIAWHTINAVRSPLSNLFTRGFLIVAPSITIRDRLRVLLPSDPDNYYKSRHLVPAGMEQDLSSARIVITNYHAFQRRRRLETNKVGEAVISGWREEELHTLETEGEMLRFLAAIAPQEPQALVFAGGLGQRIFQPPFSWSGLGIDERGRSFTLRVNYRTSHQIRSAADRLLPANLRDVDGLEDQRGQTVSVFNGPPLEILVAEDEAQEEARVAAFLQQALDGGIEPAAIGLFVRSRAQLPRARASLARAGLEATQLTGSNEGEAGRVALGTMHFAKGLEFRAVAVMACDEAVIPDAERLSDVADEMELDEIYATERQLLYVAATRARDRLLASGVEPASEFLDDLGSQD